jgi:hypothetical protein
MWGARSWMLCLLRSPCTPDLRPNHREHCDQADAHGAARAASAPTGDSARRPDPGRVIIARLPARGTTVHPQPARPCATMSAAGTLGEHLRGATRQRKSPLLQARGGVGPTILWARDGMVCRCLL